MSKIGWMAFQITVVAGVVLSVVAANDDGHPKIGAAFAMGVFLAASLSALFMRIRDGFRFGWKNSAPPKISRSDKLEGNIIVVRFVIWPTSLICLLVGLQNLGSMPLIQSATLFCFGVVAPPLLFLLENWARRRIALSPVTVARDDDAGWLPLPSIADRQISQAGDQGDGFTTRRLSRDETTEGRRRIG